MFSRLILVLSVGLTSFGFVCTEQHDPKPFRNQLQKEMTQGNAPIVRLTADGKVPVKEGGAVNVDPITAKYNNFCSSCHGTAGDGNGPAGQSMNPHPRNFTDVAWQAKTDDARITKVIKEGGASVGLSANMAAWGAVLSDEDIKAMVIKIRSFKGKK